MSDLRELSEFMENSRVTRHKLQITIEYQDISSAVDSKIGKRLGKRRILFDDICE